MKTMCPLGYHHSDFVVTHALGHMSCTVMNKEMYILMDKRRLFKHFRIEHRCSL